MPCLLEGTEIAGELRPTIAVELGLPASVKVVAGAGDNAAAACGIGALGEGDGFVSLGTSGILLAGKSGFTPNPETAVHSFCHAIPNTWYQMGVILSATDCLNWLAKIVNKSPTEMAAMLEGPLLPPGKTLFLPYLSGERTPHNDSAVRASFLGLE